MFHLQKQSYFKTFTISFQTYITTKYMTIRGRELFLHRKPTFSDAVVNINEGVINKIS